MDFLLMKSSFYLFLFLGLFCVGSGCGFLPQSPYREALPETASEIEEHKSGIVDFTYLLRAKVTEKEFLNYCGHFALKPSRQNKIAETNKNKNIETKLPEGFPLWWSPIVVGRDKIFEKRENSDIVTAKHEKGFLYLHVTHI